MRSMKSFDYSNTLVKIISYIFFVLFLYTATDKLLNYEQTELQLSKNPILTNFASVLVWLVPSLEIIISLLLIWSKTMLIGLYAAFLLMTLFTNYIIIILNFSEHIPCSCGGFISALDWEEHLVFNFIFIALSIAAIILKTAKPIRKVEDQNKEI